MASLLEPVTIAIVEDNPGFMAHFKRIVEDSPGLRLVGTAVNGRDALKMVEQTDARIYLVDLGLPDISGLDVIRHIHALRPESDAMVITMFGDEDHVVASIEAGATGYLLKEADAAEIGKAIHALLDGGSPISPSVARKLLRRFSHPASAVAAEPAVPAAKPGARTTPAKNGGLSALTGRESEILQLLAKGLTFDEISKSLFISSHTVAQHVKNIYRKLSVKSRAEAVYEAARAGAIEI